MQRGAGGPIGEQVRLQIGRGRLRREHGVHLQPQLPAVDRCRSHVIGTDRSESDHRTPVLGQCLAQQELELADLVSAVGAARDIIPLDEEGLDAKEPSQLRDWLDRRGKTPERHMSKGLGSWESVTQRQSHGASTSSYQRPHGTIEQPASKPQRRHAVGRERAVVRDQGGAFDHGLRDQEAVEGILVVKGQAA